MEITVIPVRDQLRQNAVLFLSVAVVFRQLAKGRGTFGSLKEFEEGSSGFDYRYRFF